MTDDPHDEWQVLIVQGRLCRVAVEDRDWLFVHGGEVLSWRRIDETDNGTVYRCVCVYWLEPKNEL